MSMLVAKAEVPSSLSNLKRNPISKVVSSVVSQQTQSVHYGEPKPRNNVVNLGNFRDTVSEDESDDDSERLDAWLASCASFNDGQAPERVANLVDDLGNPTGKTTKVNLILATHLDPWEQWSDGEAKATSLRKAAASLRSRGKSPVRLAHSNDSLKLKTKDWGSELSEEGPLAGFLGHARPPTLKQLMLVSFMRNKDGYYKDRFTDLDIGGWSLYYEEGTGQSMFDFYRHLNTFYESGIVEHVPKPVVSIPQVKVDDDASPVVDAFCRDETEELDRWFRTGSKYIKNWRLDAWDRHACWWNETDDRRYQVWLFKRDVHNYRQLPVLGVDWMLVHPDRIVAMLSIERMYELRDMKYNVFENYLQQIYKSSDRLWDKSTITALEEYLDTEVMSNLPIVHPDAGEPYGDGYIESLLNTAREGVSVEGFEGAKRRLYIETQHNPLNLDVDAANDVLNSTEKSSVIYDMPQRPYRVRMNEHIDFKRNLSQNDIHMTEEEVKSAVISEFRMAEFKVINGVIVPNHIEEITITERIPSGSKMMEDMVWCSVTGMFMPVSFTPSIVDRVSKGIKDFYDAI